MGAVVGSVALAEAGSPPPAPTAPASAPSPKAETPGVMSFADGAEANDRAAEVLDEVLAGEAATEPAEGEEKTDPATPAKPEEKPADPPAKEEPAPTNDVEAARLRKGFAKLAQEQQRLVELQNAARAERSAAQQYAAKAQKHDEVMAALANDPAAFLHAHGGEALVQKALQGFIDMEKSPAEREVAKLRQEREQEKAEAKQRDMEARVVTWRNDIIGKVSADERFDIVNTLGLHGKVIDVITGYYEKHSQRNDKGEVVVPAILQWDAAAQAVEEAHAAKLETSKGYGKRAPVSAAPEPKKDTPPAKPAAAPAKKASTSLSSVPVAETPLTEDDFDSSDLDVRQAQVLAALGVE